MPDAPCGDSAPADTEGLEESESYTTGTSAAHAEPLSEQEDPATGRDVAQGSGAVEDVAGSPSEIGVHACQEHDKPVESEQPACAGDQVSPAGTPPLQADTTPDHDQQASLSTCPFPSVASSWRMDTPAPLHVAPEQNPAMGCHVPDTFTEDIASATQPQPGRYDILASDSCSSPATLTRPTYSDVLEASSQLQANAKQDVKMTPLKHGTSQDLEGGFATRWAASVCKREILRTASSEEVACLSEQQLPTDDEKPRFQADRDNSAQVQELQKTVQEQESLLSAYEEANRKAAKQVKDLEQRLKHREQQALDERRALEGELLKAQQEKERARVEHHVDSSKLRRVLDLEAQLAGVQEESAQRAAEQQMTIKELQRTNDALRQEMEATPTAEQVRLDMNAMRSEYEGQVAAMSAQLAWYKGFQKSLEDKEGLIQEQAALISQLQAQVLGGAGPLVGGPHAELEQEVQQLRHEAEVHKENARAVSEAAEKQVRELQQQYEHLKRDFIARVEAAERASSADGPDGLAPGRDGAVPLAAKSSFWSQGAGGGVSGPHGFRMSSDSMPPDTGRSPSGVELGGRASAPGASENGVASSGGSTVAKQWLQLRQQLAEARQKCACREERIRSLEAALSERERAKGDLDACRAELASQQQSQWELLELREAVSQQSRLNSDLQMQLSAATEARCQAEADRARLVASQHSETAELKIQVAQLSTRLEAVQHLNASLQEASVEGAKALTEARNQQAEELHRLTRTQEALVRAAAREATAVESERAADRLLNLEVQLLNSQHRSAVLEQELKEVKRSKVLGPSARDVLSIEAQVKELAGNLDVQEQHWQSFVASASQPTSAAVGPGGVGTGPSSDTAQPAGTVRASLYDRLTLLQHEVDTVISTASALKCQHERSSWPDAASLGRG